VKHFDKLFLSLMFMLFIYINLFAQAPDTLWTRVYGGEHDDCVYDVIETFDSKYVVVGWTRSFGAGNSDVYLLKLDSNGDTMWTKTFGGPLDDEGRSVQEMSDHGFIIAGWTESFGAGKSDIYLIRTNMNGDTIWTRTYGGVNYDYAFSAQETSDSVYIIVGRTYFNGSFDIYLINTNLNGSVLWEKIYENVGWDAGCSVQESAEIFGGYVIAGLTASTSEGWNVYLLKTYGNGDTIWTKNYGGTNWDAGYSVQKTYDGGYITAGLTKSFGTGSFDIYLVKAKRNGNTVWTRTFGGADWDESYAVQETPDKGFIIAGATKSFGAGGFDVYLIRTYSNGYPIWTKTYGGANWDVGYSIENTSDGGYIIAGKTKSFGAGLYDVYLIKTKPDLGIEEKKDARQKIQDIRLSAQPNPFTDKTVIEFKSSGVESSTPITLKVYDISGRLVRSFPSSLFSLHSSVTWDGRDDKGKRVKTGVYFIKLEVKSKNLKTSNTKKVMLIR